MFEAEVMKGLLELALADQPLEVERLRCGILHLVGEAPDGLVTLVDALAKRSMRACELARLATEDALTGLENRRSFVQGFRRELARRQRVLGPAVVLLDLDGLKHINDTLGHGAGDEAIRRAAHACLDGVRAGDLAARLGGDELALLLPETDLEGALIVADRVREAIESEDVMGVQLKVSLGVAVAGPDCDSEAAVLATADQRMYHDKRSRKGGVSLAA